MQVSNVLHTARWKYRTQKIAKNSPSGTIAQICPAMSSQLSHISTIRKKLLNSNIFSTCPPQYDELRPANGWDLLASLGHPYKFLPVSRLRFVTVPQRRRHCGRWHVQIAKRFEPSTVLWAFHTIQPS